MSVLDIDCLVVFLSWDPEAKQVSTNLGRNSWL